MNPDVLKLLERRVMRYREMLDIAIEALTKNANEDYRGNRSSASVRSFEALTKIEALKKEIP